LLGDNYVSDYSDQDRLSGTFTDEDAANYYIEVKPRGFFIKVKLLLEFDRHFSLEHISSGMKKAGINDIVIVIVYEVNIIKNIRRRF